MATFLHNIHTTSPLKASNRSCCHGDSHATLENAFSFAQVSRDGSWTWALLLDPPSLEIWKALASSFGKLTPATAIEWNVELNWTLYRLINFTSSKTKKDMLNVPVQSMSMHKAGPGWENYLQLSDVTGCNGQINMSTKRYKKRAPSLLQFNINLIIIILNRGLFNFGACGMAFLVLLVLATKKREHLTSQYHAVTGEYVACLEFSDDRPGISNDEHHRMYNFGSRTSDSESMAVLAALWWTWIHWFLWRLRWRLWRLICPRFGLIGILGLLSRRRHGFRCTALPVGGGISPGSHRGTSQTSHPLYTRLKQYCVTCHCHKTSYNWKLSSIVSIDNKLMSCLQGKFNPSWKTYSASVLCIKSEVPAPAQSDTLWCWAQQDLGGHYHQYL